MAEIALDVLTTTCGDRVRWEGSLGLGGRDKGRWMDGWGKRTGAVKEGLPNNNKQQ